MEDDRNKRPGSKLPGGENGNNKSPAGAGKDNNSDRLDSLEKAKLAAGPDWYDELEGFYDQSKSKRGNKAVKNRKPMSRLKKMLLITAGGLLLLLAGMGTYVLALYDDVQEPQRILLDEISFEEGYEIDAAFSDDIVNIALLGFDRGWSREKMGEELFRPDMLAVFSINFETEQVSVVRIPRDSYVPIYGRGGMHDKINHSFVYGYYSADGEDREAAGIEYTLRTISNTLGGIPLHYYVSVDMYSVIELVDAVGGVYYEVEETIYDEHWDVGRVLVPEGPQIMDGKTYLRYLQYRGGARGDIGRIDRQMNLLRETFKYLRAEGKITDIPATYRIYKDYVDTDLTYKQIAAMAYFARNLDLSDQSLRFYTLTGSGQMKDGVYYKVLNQGERLRIIKEAFGLEVEPWPPIVLEDSLEYLKEQERKRILEEELEKADWLEDEDIDQEEIDQKIEEIKKRIEEEIDDEELEKIIKERDEEERDEEERDEPEIDEPGETDKTEQEEPLQDSDGHDREDREGAEDEADESSEDFHDENDQGG